MRRNGNRIARRIMPKILIGVRPPQPLTWLPLPAPGHRQLYFHCRNAVVNYLAAEFLSRPWISPLTAVRLGLGATWDPMNDLTAGATIRRELLQSDPMAKTAPVV